MGKKKFEPNKWVKFEIDGITIVGRTLESVDGKCYVAIVDAIGNSGVLPWSMVEEKAEKLCKLTFLQTKREEDFIKEHGKPTIVFQDEPKKDDSLRASLEMFGLFGNKIGEA